MKFFLTATQNTIVESGEMKGKKWNKTFTHCVDEKNNNFILIVKNTDLNLATGVNIEIESINEYSVPQQCVMFYSTGTGQYKKQCPAFKAYVIEINARPENKFNEYRINNISKK